MKQHRGVVQPAHVVGEAEHRRPPRGRVGADPLEHAGAVVQRVREHVDRRVVPVDELAVHPDLVGLVEWHVARS